MIIKKLVLIILLLIGFMACYKDSFSNQKDPDQLTNETIIEGHVRDPWGKPLPGAQVRCMVTAGIPYVNTWNYWLPVVTTDSNGYYRFHDKDTRDVFQYDILPPLLDGYYEGGIKFAGPNFRNTIDFELRPHAWIRVHFKNVNPVNSQDFCQYYLSSFTGHSWNVKGMFVDESKLFKGAGGTPSTMHWRVTKGGVETVHHDTIILPGHDTTQYLIEF
ncbi:MAG: carboxypeptidase regulatory-like domain-containing protein [Saprospiraceae bacterium]|nr:carboxypeptidase regulatory-like domain-containing protein [Saprospiraceae bacterium]